MCVEDLGVPVDLPSPRWTPHCHQHRQRGAHHSQGIPRFPLSSTIYWFFAGWPRGGTLSHGPHLACLHLLLDCCLLSQVKAKSVLNINFFLSRREMKK